MELLTEEFIETMKPYPYYSQKDENDPIVLVKFFNPCGNGTWFITEYEPEDEIAFGYVTGLGHDELGSISIRELESIQLPFDLTIERDLHFKPCTLSECSSFVPAKEEENQNGEEQ